jgi:hypothetical protein
VKKPTWTHVKTKLASYDQADLLGPVQDLYTAHKDNRTFLHARLGLGDEILEPYKQTIARLLWPDVIRDQKPSVAKAKQAVSDYKKAVGQPEGMAELTVFFCEQAAGFCHNFGYDDETYFGALVRMFEQALIVIRSLPAGDRHALIDRLDQVRVIGHDFGYGVGDDLDILFEKDSET